MGQARFLREDYPRQDRITRSAVALPNSCLLFAGNLKDRATRAWSDDAPPHLALSPTSSIPESAVRWKREGCDRTGDMVGFGEMKLLWIPTILPRTMNRREWREIYRWKRVEEKKLRQMETEAIRLAAMFDRAEMLDRILNPPMLVHPLMQPPVSFSTP